MKATYQPTRRPFYLDQELYNHYVDCKICDSTQQKINKIFEKYQLTKLMLIPVDLDHTTI